MARFYKLAGAYPAEAASVQKAESERHGSSPPPAAENNPKMDTLVVIAAGINTKDALSPFGGLFYELAQELEKRYGGRAKIIVTYPLGEGKAPRTAAEQAAKVAVHMLDNQGGKSVADAVLANKNGLDKIILIGHSGGGQAVGDALYELDKMGIEVHHALQIGAPKDKIKKKYAGQTTRVDAPTDIVANYVTIGNVTGLASLLSPKAGITRAVGQALASPWYQFPETLVVPIVPRPNDPTGGHSDYFTRKNGNLYLWLDKVWDKIK